MDAKIKKQLRDEAYSLYLQGEFQPAIQKQISLINDKTNKDNYEDKHILSLFLFQSGDIPSAASLLQHLHEEKPDDVEVLKNFGMSLIKIGRLEEAVRALKRALKLDDTIADVHDALAHVSGLLGDRKTSKQHGERALLLKDEQSCRQGTVFPLPKSPPPRFDAADRNKNIIAFSLWGDKKRYIDGAIKNAELAADIYPGWCCRFYHDDSVPVGVITKLQGYAAQTIQMPKQKELFNGLFWRFQVANDVNVRRFLVRDCDSVINMKERAAVDEWLLSDKYFHILRDFYTHTELVLAGLWGGVAGVLPPMDKLISAMPGNVLKSRIVDQLFLRNFLWPTMKTSCMIHDSQFSMPNSRDFPYPGLLPPHRHVGQDNSVLE